MSAYAYHLLKWDIWEAISKDTQAFRADQICAAALAGITSTATAIAQAIATGGSSVQANSLALAYALGTSQSTAVAQASLLR